MMAAVYILWWDKEWGLLHRHFHPNTDQMDRMAAEYMAAELLLDMGYTMDTDFRVAAYQKRWLIYIR